jgi:hypothetical protein
VFVSETYLGAMTFGGNSGAWRAIGGMAGDRLPREL